MISLVFLVALSFSMVSVHLFAYRPAYVDEGSEENFWLPRFPPIGGKEVTIEEAQALVSFKIQLPAKLGQPVQVKFNRDHVIIIWMQSKPPREASIYDVINQGGIVLFIYPNSMTLEESIKNIEAAINATKDQEGALQKVDINGYIGCMGGNVKHNICWYTETTAYELVASNKFPLQQLLEIARSTPLIDGA